MIRAKDTTEKDLIWFRISRDIGLAPQSPLRAVVFVAMWFPGRFNLVIWLTRFKATSVTYIESCLKPPLKSLPAEADRKKMILDQDLAPAGRAKKTGIPKEHSAQFCSGIGNSPKLLGCSPSWILLIKRFEGATYQIWLDRKLPTALEDFAEWMSINSTRDRKRQFWFLAPSRSEGRARKRILYSVNHLYIMILESFLCFGMPFPVKECDC